MEGGADFHGFQGLQRSNSAAAAALRLPKPAASGGSAEAMTTIPTQAPAPASGGSDGNSSNTVREQDRFMPIANVIRIMRKVLPAHAKISDDAKETIQECVSEYISFITSEANERCQREQRKTVTAEDVLWAMSKLGFDDYVQPLTLYLQRYREVEGDHRGSIRGDPLPPLKPRLPPPMHGLPAAAQDGGSALYGGPMMMMPPPPPPFGQGQYLGYGDGMVHSMGGGGYYFGGGVSYGNGVGDGSTSQAPGMPAFDPYAAYK